MKRWLKIGAAIILVWLLLRHLDWSEVGRIVLGASPWWIGAYILLQLLGNVISAAKWRYLGGIQHFNFSLRDGFFAYLTGAFFNNFFPSTIGGDVYRTLWMKKNGDGWRAFTVIFFDRLSGILTLFVLSSIGFFIVPLEVWLDTPGLFVVAALILFVTVAVILSLLWTYGVFELIFSVVNYLPWQRPKAFLECFRVFAEGTVYLRSFGWATLFALFGIALNNYALFRGLGAETSFLAFAGVIFLATLIASIPISVGNIGVKEWSYVFFFGLIGLSPELAVATALLSRFIQMFLSLLSLPWYLREKKTLSREALSTGTTLPAS